MSSIFGMKKADLSGKIKNKCWWIRWYM